MLGTTICSTMWPSRSGGIPTPISDPSMVTRNRILLLLLPCNPYQVAPPLTMIPDNKSVNTFLGAQQQTLIKLSFTENPRRGVLGRSITLADFLHRKGRLDSKLPRVIFGR